ncbi:phosphate ABC transporter substrate-binding protein [Helicobacter pullorum]|uniref:substrate-binding domain-containing protein n=1 Tax=Helicobacter pullorum TaxID=35818 RepID=UPI000816A1A9|nr:substrate-binding domain-containing protein [Helicobacter pullorum]OCR03708.1 phosphate ABC transporter substrate-binding protein [Helicobacter pullorum]OCR07074.1 phosphate ABC transporter substrate-binding protein [Helicobacter pullorum]OCR09967.1 phosphate ABC transporter substrate-binding protein [Helicobacter pullorum]OCR11959.1 phosphate ABC transporter substrate-binding protein [Helicobacter pullorum]
MKKYLLGLLASCMLGGVLMAQDIFPISREMGSGTRGAFVEIFGIQKEVRNKKVDATTQKAEVTNSTGVMMTTVANSANSIGYISLGSLNDTIKAVSIDGVSPSVQNINNKTYGISRPFNVVTKAMNPVIEDFLKYALSKEAKGIVEKAGYISVAKDSYVSTKPSGKIIIAGSSSVTPLMEKLKESYEKINPNVEIEIQQSDSTTGVNSVVEGIADIGMASREIKESELKKGINAQVLAIDGLAVIVNKENPISNLKKEDVRKIFLGEITNWEQVK